MPIKHTDIIVETKKTSSSSYSSGRAQSINKARHSSGRRTSTTARHSPGRAQGTNIGTSFTRAGTRRRPYTQTRRASHPFGNGHRPGPGVRAPLVGALLAICRRRDTFIWAGAWHKRRCIVHRGGHKARAGTRHRPYTQTRRASRPFGNGRRPGPGVRAPLVGALLGIRKTAEKRAPPFPCRRGGTQKKGGRFFRIAPPKMAASYSPGFPVPSAQAGLTSLFGMGRGGSPPP